MKPRSIRSLYPAVSVSTGFAEADVKLINDFYWKEVRTRMSDLTKPAISLLGLGEMRLKHWKLEEHIATTQYKANTASKWNTATGESPYYTAYAKDLVKLEAMRLMVAADTEKRVINKQKRLDYGS